MIAPIPPPRPDSWQPLRAGGRDKRRAPEDDDALLRRLDANELYDIHQGLDWCEREMRALGLLRLGQRRQVAALRRRWAYRWRAATGRPAVSLRVHRAWQLGAIVGLGATLLAVVSGPDQQAAPALAPRLVLPAPEVGVVPAPTPIPRSGPFTHGAGPDRPDRTTRRRRDRPRGQVASAGSRPPPAAVPAGQPDVSRLRRRHCVPHCAQRDDPRAHRGPIHAHGRGELRQRLHHRPRRSSRQRPHVHDGGCPRLPPQRPLVNEVSRGADPSGAVSPCHEQPARGPIAQLPLARIAALAVRPLSSAPDRRKQQRTRRVDIGSRRDQTRVQATPRRMRCPDGTHSPLLCSVHL